MQQEQHSLGLVGIFRLFLDKLRQPYVQKNKKTIILIKQHLNLSQTSRTSENGGGEVSSTNVCRPHLDRNLLGTCCLVELWLATGKIDIQTVRNLKMGFHRFT